MTLMLIAGKKKKNVVFFLPRRHVSPTLAGTKNLDQVLFLVATKISTFR